MAAQIVRNVPGLQHNAHLGLRALAGLCVFTNMGSGSSPGRECYPLDAGPMVVGGGIWLWTRQRSFRLAR